MHDDTIAAIATPLGEGGLAVIRISGPEAFAVADKIFLPGGKSSLKPSAAPTHTIHYGQIARHGETVDEVLLSVLCAPRTFTREDTVEISCHGGILPAKLVLDAVLENGARLAEPGEFTRRAFLNGRLDLAQAEAVADLIHSRTELALAAANEQLAGKLSQRINQLRDEMMKTLAHVEAHIDFPDEDIAPETRAQLIRRLENGVAFMDELLRTANEGQILRRGIRTAIVGRPNAGKSSLLNQLLGHDRAIVSPIPGTTRDTIEETANIRGLPVVFIDTAGLREARDEIEVEGIRRSRETLAKAELILHVLDASEPLTPADEMYLTEFAGKKRILVRNKTDLPVKLNLGSLSSPKGGEGRGEEADGFLQFTNPSPQPSPRLGEEREIAPPIVDVCCLTGQGMEALKDAIKGLVWAGKIEAGMLQVMINSRHQEALGRTREATLRTIEALRADVTLELVALDLRIAVNAVGEIVGKTATEDLLDSIFSQFCLGK
ncbi:MAG: tRNA uridine-5-carboxymethylaminomethyl(34) synthesis GTPase MnmE [Verrucomicrobiales bacterium]|nr:tRNA uridine-5-carboxymethylaminomethyl(34) synthesis GTPase MnmE [Verrucomicrobiales bacterium]